VGGKGISFLNNIFAMSDDILIGVMKAVYRSNLRIPEDISVLAISNGFMPGLFNPSITYVETSGYEPDSYRVGNS
jgi:LacI family transcriptional regulator